MPLPTATLWVLGAAGTVVIARLLAKEWQRVNAALHPTRAAPVNDKMARAQLPTLRRDPRTGIYRLG